MPHTYKGRTYDIVISDNGAIHLESHATGPDFADGHNILLERDLTDAAIRCSTTEMRHNPKTTVYQMEKYFRESQDIGEFLINELEQGRAHVDFGDGEPKPLSTLNDIEL